MNKNNKCNRCLERKVLAKNLCNRCYYATKNGFLTYPEMIKKYNYIENNYGILSTKKKEKFIVDLDDFDKFKNYIWHSNGSGYAKHNKLGFLHRKICPNFKVVDHINGNTFDNRKYNLREGKYINVLNTNKRKKPCPIYKNKNGYWYGQTTIEGKRFYIPQSKNRNKIVIQLTKLLTNSNRINFYQLS